jgi:hypothetical protein
VNGSAAAQSAAITQNDRPANVWYSHPELSVTAATAAPTAKVP